MKRKVSANLVLTGSGKNMTNIGNSETRETRSAYEKESEVDSLKQQITVLKQRIVELEKRNRKAVRKFNQAQELKPYQVELIQLQNHLERTGKKMIIIFEGRGGAGKGGMPTDEEKSQWFFQKYIKEFPHAGEIVLFDRSWYSRAIIEPVFGFCSDLEYENFMEGVRGFEKDLIRQGVILIKLYFSVTKEEQARRFAQRRKDPLHHWKLNEVDIDAEEYRDEFTAAKFNMLKRTHTIHAPWTIIRSDNKHLARLNAMKMILNSTEYEPLDPDLDISLDPDVVVSGSYELERMEAQRLRSGIYY